MPNFDKKPSWRVMVPRSWFRQASLAELREVIDTFDFMAEGVGQTRGIVVVTGMGDMPLWAQPFASVDQ